MTFKVTLKVTKVNFGLLFLKFDLHYRKPENGENSVPECSKVLFLTFGLHFFRVLLNTGPAHYGSVLI